MARTRGWPAAAWAGVAQHWPGAGGEPAQRAAAQQRGGHQREQGEPVGLTERGQAGQLHQPGTA